MDIRELTLEARKVLTAEVRDLLEGVYGLGTDGRFAPASGLPALRKLPDAGETRKRLEAFLDEEVAAGLKLPDAVEKLVKEVAFTHLNRLVAFKMLETRKLVRGTIDKLHDSNAFKFYLAERTDEEALYRRGTMPQDALGEGPRDAAYRRFLLAQSGKLAEEIRVLFDPENLPSRLFPRPLALQRVVDLLNSEDVRSAWEPGNEETIGWVYQFWNAEEKAEAFRRVFKEKKKFRPEDIPAATQLFTPQWIVRFLVENTVGRLWVQMHPDSRLRDRLEYLVPLEGEVPRAPLRMAREITILDPACGTMHFGLVAFDILAEMYREELEHAGQPGWPDTASVRNEDEIPGSILENNLFGMDIDLRAVQLSALTLLIKAKTASKKTAVRRSNLACTGVLLADGERLARFLKDAGLEKPIYARVLTSVWHRLEGSMQKGSLLRLEEDVRRLIADERRAHGKHKEESPILPDRERFGDEYGGGTEFWEQLEGQLVQAIDEFAKRQAESGLGVAFFTEEAAKGCRALELMMRRYDIVVTNPPYMSRRNMDPELAAFLASAYPDSKGDLYTAFIERCGELLAPGGRVGMITQQSFLFISSYEKLREKLSKAQAIETMCHVGPHAFDEIAGEKVNTTLFVLRQEPDAAQRENSIGTYFRLVKEPDSEAKRRGFERAVKRLRAGEADPAVYRYRQGDFGVIPGAPWVYWIPQKIRALFQGLQGFGECAELRQGLATADNGRFLRFWWECGTSRIAWGLSSRDAALKHASGWFPYVKGGEFRRWWGNQEYSVNWGKDGAEIRNLAIESGKIASRPQNTQYYFRAGVTWSSLATKLSVRVLPPGYIFADKGEGGFARDESRVLGFMNSRPFGFLASLVSPTIDFHSGPLSRVPIPDAPSRVLTDLVDQAVAAARTESQDSETTYDFISPPAWPTGPADVAARQAKLAQIEREIDEEVYRLYGIGEEDRKAIEAELAEPPGVDEDGEAGEPEGDEESDDEAESSLTPADLAKQWISYAVGIVLGRFELRDGTPPETERWIGRGRFTKDQRARVKPLVDADGVAVLDPDHPDDLASRVFGVLEVLVGDQGALDLVAAGLGDEGSPEERLRQYLGGAFFKEHVQRYRKRPVYWLLQSPDREFSVYVFHERITGDTLPRIRGERYLRARIHKVTSAVTEARGKLKGADGRAKRTLEKDIERGDDVLHDLHAFDERIGAVLEQEDETGKTVGWAHEIDDGVILNLAPLSGLMPAWSKEPAKYWDLLEKGKLDWARTAMRYWPARVLKACRTNKSFAIAHGRLDVYQGGA